MSNEFVDRFVWVHAGKFSYHNKVCLDAKFPEFGHLNVVPGVYDAEDYIESLVEISNDLRCFQITFIKIEKGDYMRPILWLVKPVRHWTIVSRALLKKSNRYRLIRLIFGFEQKITVLPQIVPALE